MTRVAWGWPLGLALVCVLPAQQTAPLLRDGDYVGAARCIECHGRQHRQLLAHSHRGVMDPALPGCELCHGPGRAHAEEADNPPERITLPAELSARSQRAFCGRCHEDQIRRHGGDPDGLLLAGRSCSECHQVHGDAARGEPERSMRGLADSRVQAKPIGSAACIECHPLRDSSLVAGPHRELAAAACDDGCETCHGNGSLHAASRGRADLIVRPDRAEDGVAACSGCHTDVDARRFHWPAGLPASLTSAATCATCHRVHQPPAEPAGLRAQVAEPLTNRVCATCHVQVGCSMPGSTHASIGALDQPLAAGCAACHQDALEHAEGSGRKTPGLLLGGLDPKAQSQTCLTCHQDERSLLHVTAGVHARSGIGCVACHAPLHGARHADVADDAEAHCARCHPDVAMEFRLPNRHPVGEAGMRCGSCHRVHGGEHRPHDHHLSAAVCTECHPSYRGPFVYEHQAGRRDGCVICHVPHGSPNRRMLRQASTQQNCTSCHGDFPAFHDQTPGSTFTDCIRCHTQVHGSNHSRYLFR